MSFIRMMNEKQDEKPVAQAPDVTNGDSHFIFAATDATFIECDSTESSQERVVRHEKTYYRLTPEYWAWFRNKYEIMEKALVAGKISEAAFEKILDRISALYNQAVAIFGKEMLDMAVRNQDIAAVDEMIRGGNDAVTTPRRPRRPSLVAEHGVRPAQKPTSAPSAPARNPAATRVDAIRDKAMALGWNRDQLYRTDGIAYRDWGLIRFIGADDEIGEVTQQHIEVINKKKGYKHHFYNQNVDQPWMKKCDARGEPTDAVQKCG